MFACWERRKPPVKTEPVAPKPDDAVDTREETDVEGRDYDRMPRQRFPEGYIERNHQLFADCIVGANLMGRQRQSHIAWYKKKLKEGKPKYQTASKLLEQQGIVIPWQVIGVIHGLEGSFNFDKQLLNGQKWWQRTTWVPKNEGPWSSWEESTVYAFKSDMTYHRIPEVWGVAETALFLERWNGMSYWRMRRPSPYLWGFSSVQVAGKFVADGKYSRTAITLQVGGMCQLIELDFPFDERGLRA